jgi:hypothetical protein
MIRLKFLLPLVFLASLSCSSGPKRFTQAVAVTPSTAEAPGAPNSQVQFTATGTFNTSPITVTPLPAKWAVVNLDFSQTTAVAIDSTGLAQCSASASGTYSVGAWTYIDPTSKVFCESIGPYGEPGCNSVLGTAQLTCP